jgi:hypothetical protein
MKKNNREDSAADIYELISHFDLISLEDLPNLVDWKPSKTEALQAALWDRIYAAQYSDPLPLNDSDRFRFLASASIRGDTCPGCRSGKIESLARFAALYSDETIIPLPLLRPDKELSFARARLDLFSTIESLIRMRPLVELGIAKPAVMSTAVQCKHELAETQELIDIASSVADQLADAVIDQFTMFYEPGTGDESSPTLYIRGPEEYLEHGQIVARLPEVPEWAAKSWRPNRDGLIRVPNRTARRIGIVQALFQRIASDTTFHLAYGIPRRAKMITDLPGDTELLRAIDQEDSEVQNQRTVLLNALSHALPFTEELSLAETVKLREELRGAFEQYRFAITSIVRSHERDAGLTPRIATQIFKDELQPKINALENQIQAERTRMRNKALATGGVISVIVALGLLGTILPSMALGLLGGAATMKVADQIGDAISPQPQTVSNDLYFLLKLKQRSRNR